MKNKNVQIMKKMDRSQPEKVKPPRTRNPKEHWNYQVSTDICQICGDLGHRQETCDKK